MILIAAESFWLNPASYWAIFQMVMGLGAVIFVHELGHFLVAKMCGVKCEKFYVGFDAFDIKIGDRVIIPRSLVKYQFGETEYGIGVMPFGGYVKMLGQDDNPGNMEAEIKRSMADGEDVSQAMSAGLIDRDKMDPRSFLAKSVIQRMMIISAGVVFNLLFAILFAAIAFKAGVDYTPPAVGTVLAGSPAWAENLVGAEFVAIEDKVVTDQYFTFTDIAQEIVLGPNGEPIDVKVKPYGSETVQTIPTKPIPGLRRQAPDAALIGISPRTKPVIGKGGAIPGNTADQAEPALEEGDRIIEINGTPIETDIDLRHVLVRDANQVATFSLERTSADGVKSIIKTDVAPNPLKRLGFGVAWNSITAIQTDSPAATADLQIGDEIIKIDGAPRGDLLLLNKQMTEAAVNQKTVTLTIKRGDEEKTVDISPIVPNVPATPSPLQVVAVDSLGVAIGFEHIVESLESTAKESGLAVGDKIQSMEFLLSDDQKKEDRLDWMIDEVLDIAGGEINWAEIEKHLQTTAAGTVVKINVQRGTEKKSFELKSFASETYFLDTRGIALQMMQWHYQAPTWGEAFANGSDRVWKDATRVLRFLKKVVTGQLSATNFGGPGTIAVVATSEASQGTSRLLLFLVLLSANLAVVNFLPIPVLDGGHMMMLAYEGLFRRPVTPAVQNVLMLFGFVFIIGLMLFVVTMDIFRIAELF